MSLIIQVWMLPLVVIYFHRFSASSVFLNLWVGIFLAAESFAGVAAVLISYVSPWLATPLIVLTELLNQGMMAVPAWTSDRGMAGFRLPVYSGYGRIVYVLYAIAVAVTAREIYEWSPFKLVPSQRTIMRTIAPALSVLILAAIIIQHPFSSPVPDGKLRIHFLDVGQGDSALVVFPGGETMLVDGGGRPSYRDNDESFTPDVPRIGESVVSEFLWELGYSRIDYIVATHADADHMQGLSDVAKNFDIGRLMIGTTNPGDAEYDELMRVVEKSRIPITTVRRGDELSISGATVRVMGPPADLESDSANNSSVVLRIGFGSRSFLLSGDIERPAESNLAADSCEDIRSDLVKVPHHGSKTSSTEIFVNCVKPIAAVISVGLRSQFGHPHPEVVERWRKSGARILQTGIAGTVTATTDGSEMEVRTFVP